MRIGITGHMNLTPATVELVRAALKTELAQYDPSELIGVSCLAEGADSIFAQAILDAGGQLEALLPAPDYRDTRVSQAHLPTFDALASQAHKIRYIAEASSMQVYAEANTTMIETIDILYAVWDGKPSTKTGGTADAVDTALKRGIRVSSFWPKGSERG